MKIVKKGGGGGSREKGGGGNEIHAPCACGRMQLLHREVQDVHFAFRLLIFCMLLNHSFFLHLTISVDVIHHE
jgi:hypothetical protein